MDAHAIYHIHEVKACRSPLFFTLYRQKFNINLGSQNLTDKYDQQMFPFTI